MKYEKLDDKIILITGSTDGIGKRTAIELAGTGARVLIHGKNPEKTRKALAEIRDITGNQNLDIFLADLSLQQQVRDLAQEVRRRYDHLDVLINNAGVYQLKRELTQDGLEMTFAVNYMATFLLSMLLLDYIQKSAMGRIVNVSSMAHSHAIDFGNLQGEKDFSPYGAYSLSKLCQIMFSYELATRLKDDSITVNCLHPGVINTKLLHKAWSGGADVSLGSKNLMFCAASTEITGVSGKYFVNMEPQRSTDISYDPIFRKHLWLMSEELGGISEGDIKLELKNTMVKSLN